MTQIRRIEESFNNSKLKVMEGNGKAVTNNVRVI